MPSLILDDRLIWFAHCPKAGGTSIEQAMVAAWGDRVGHLDWGWQRRRRGAGGGGFPSSPQHLVWRDAERLLPRSPDAAFAVVRDPVTRMESEHRWQRRQREATRLGRLLARLPFPIWLRLMLALARRYPHAYDNHLRPQADFVPPTARVFRLEEGLAPLSRWLGDITGTPLPEMPHALRGAAAAVATAACRARIAAAFAADYARFGYRRSADPPPPRDLLDALAERLAPVLAALDRRARL